MDEAVGKSGALGISYELFGRRTIYASFDEINEQNVIEAVNNALTFHLKNLQEEEFLYWYRRGLQPVLWRTKEVRPEICNKVVENHANEIVDFKNGYFLTQPAFYISRKEDKETNEKVRVLNDYLFTSGKQQADNELVDWFHTVGKAALYVDARGDGGSEPVKVFALDPRSAFVVYSLRPGNEPVMGINMVVTDNVVRFDVYTQNRVFRLSGGVSGRFISNVPTYVATAIEITSIESNPLGEIPIIEYQYNSVGMSAFESVIPLLDAINNVQSNRLDGVEQFIQSLAIAVNCDFEEGVTANDIRRAGMVVLKTHGENKADFRILSEELDQNQTQVFVDYLYQQVLTICGMPSTTKGGRSTSDTGAAVLARDGWYQADTVARNTEDLFKKSNTRFDRLLIKILRRKGVLDIAETDFELQFVRNETANIQSKAQAFQTLLAAGLHPELAAAKSGISNDPVSDIGMSSEYLKMIWGDPEKVVESENAGDGTGEAKVLEEDRFTGANMTGGAV